MSARLVREPGNRHDPNAIAVYLRLPFLLVFRRDVKIGYIKAARAERLAAKLDAGVVAKAHVVSFWAPPDRGFPRVSIEIELIEK